MLGKKSKLQEVGYLDFINQYLSKNQVKLITMYKDKTSEMF